MVEIGETAMVGLDAELEYFRDKLTLGYPSNLHTLSIVGMGGIGKTTLAKNIYENKIIKERFQFRAWSTISQQHNAKEIISQLLHGLGKSNYVAEAVDKMGLELYQKLYGRRYLLILDDIWNVRAWDEVKHYFPDNTNGSRIVLTTRLSNVAKDCGSSPFMMKFLDEDNSKKLFWDKALKNEPCPPQLREVGEEIVKLCRGLALSIVVMGGLLLKSPKTVEYWNGVVKDIKSISGSTEKNESLHVLSQSYNHLPSHLKPCFLYMGVFQEDSKIRVSKVIRLWVGEGFIKPNGFQDLEEIGEGYIKDLIDRNLLLVGGLRKNQKIGSCGIHYLMRDLCIQIGEQQEFYHGSDDWIIQGSWRRLTCSKTNKIEVQIPLVRSIMSTYTVGRLMQQELLRVLDYRGIEDSTAELYSNVNLRYLAYEQPATKETLTVWRLPSLVSLLWNLQTLIIQGYWSSPVVVAPIEIWKMRQLRHVDCNKIHLPLCNEMMNLENLRTLKTAVNLNLCEEVCKSIPNIKKLYLLYDHEKQGYDDGLIEDLCNLHRLDKLESLKLNFKSRKWPSPDTQMNKNLSFPMSLNKLSLSNCLLEWIDLTVIGSLPQPQVLMLEDNSVHGGEWSPVDGQFEHLKFLKIQNPGLVHWNADNSHFPVLEKLVLDYMVSLIEIPNGIGDIPTLETIRVEISSTSSAVSAVKIRQDQLDNGSDSLQIQLRLLWVEDFMKMVESERLSITGIQLE